tara:strand:- start:39 stop:752 length:714 start_codon:yes stop_codon:yes gene_type:complete
MDTRCILLFVFILVLLFILNNNNNNNKETFINVKIPNSILKYFFQKEFLMMVGESKITYLKYKNNSLDAISYNKSTINKFLKNTKNTKKYRYQIKQIFNNNKLANYILEYGYNPIVKFLGLNEKTTKPGYIRLSKNNWSFDYHYDCLDLILVQLIGTRTIYTKKTKKGKITKHILKPGNTLFIPMGVYHKVITKNGLNLNFNIILENTNVNKIRKCTLNFSKDYKKQNEKCQKNNCI